MAEYELFVDTEFGGGRGAPPGVRTVEPMRLEELEAKAATHEEVLVELRDITTLENIKVRAILGLTPEAVPGGEILWLIRTSGRFSSPWSIKIIERLEDEDDEVAALPRRKLSLAERKGRILSDLLKERDEKMGEGKKDGSEK